MYTAGYSSLHTCYPRRGFQWMQRGSRQAMEYIPRAIGELYEVAVCRFVNCLPIKADKQRVPYGHLGSHPTNLALYLAESGNMAWRLQQYAELWLLLQTDQMIGQDDSCLHSVYACRQGKHRSFAWSLVESAIFSRLGFGVRYENTCKWAQQKSNCQRSNWPNGCEMCGNCEDDFAGLSDNTKRVVDAYVEEFFEAVLTLERAVGAAVVQ